MVPSVTIGERESGILSLVSAIAVGRQFVNIVNWSIEADLKRCTLVILLHYASVVEFTSTVAPAGAPCTLTSQ